MNVILFLKDRLKKIEEQSIEIEKNLKKKGLLNKDEKNNKK